MEPGRLNQFPNLEGVKMVVFDLDGTLYDQRKLRIYMAIYLLFHLLTCKLKWSELKVLSTFRKQREIHKGFSAKNIQLLQYSWVSDSIDASVEEVTLLVEKYMFKAPLRFLKYCRYPFITEVFSVLAKKDIAIAIYSDYPIQEKILTLGLNSSYMICSTDFEIDQLKPTGTGLLYLGQQAGLKKSEMLFIGDRADTDGASADMAGIDFLLLNISEARKGKFYKNFTKHVLSFYDK